MAPGQRVVGGLDLEALPHHDTVGDVLEAPDDPREHPARVHQGAEPEGTVAVVTLRREAELEVGLGVEGHGGRQGVGDAVPVGFVGGGDEIGERGELGDTEDVVELLVDEEELAVLVGVEQPQRHRLGQLGEELLAGPDGLVGGHLLGDVDHVGHDVPVLRIVDPVDVGDLEPDPAPVGVAVAEAGPAPGTGRGQHVHPVGDGRVAVVGVDEFERPLAHDLLRGPPQHLREGVVDLRVQGDAVLVGPGQPGRRQGYLPLIERIR